MKPQNITHILIGIVCFGLLPQMQAVSPAPDGDYPGGNTAEGQNALLSRTTGSYNTAIGYLSLLSDTTNSFNTAIGAGTLLANTADRNTATGAGALLRNTTGIGNTANGSFALGSNTAGTANTGIGVGALYNNTGDNNIGLGNGAGFNVTTASNVICIGAEGNNIDNACYIGQIFGATSVNGVAVLINSNGRLGTMTSSARVKDQIKPMDKASEALFALKPVAFRYKKEIDPAGTPQLGLVAEEVEKVNPDLIVRDKQGKPYSVRYDQVNAMLLNEFLKEHGTVQEQGAIITRQRKDFESAIAQLQKQIEALSAGLQKVSAQLKPSKSAPQKVENTQ
jgi:endosialidase-like protein